MATPTRPGSAPAVPVQVNIVPRFEVREQLTRAEAQLSKIRGELLDVAANLGRIRGQAELCAHLIRAANLGIVPGVDPEALPKPDDIIELQAAHEAVLRLVDAVAAVTSPTVAPPKPAS